MTPPHHIIITIVILSATPIFATKQDQIWRYLAKHDADLRPKRPSIVSDLQGENDDSFDVAVHIDTSKLEITLGGKVVYEAAGGVPKMGHRWPHSGVHVVVMNACDGRVMMKQRFITYQPGEESVMADALSAVQPGRIVIVAAVPEWLMFFGEKGENALKGLGFTFSSRIASGEPWAGVAVKGQRVIGEGVTLGQLGQYPANTLRFEVRILKECLADPRCEWYSDPKMRLQAEFCELYEGYGDLCSCRDPFTSEVRSKQPNIPDMQETIPVVIVTANKPRHLYRLLHNLFTIRGSNDTPLLVAIDGAQRETSALSSVLGVSWVFHTPVGAHNERTNANVRFALFSVFATFPEADKAIVLEDDLLLAPDFFSFFHQTAWLLDNDPTIFCVNAFNSNSLPGLASDQTKLLRSESFPMYGWMVNREYAAQVVPRWIPYGFGDWDWYLLRWDSTRGRDVLSPEVSRTFHAGSAGAHVDGFEQHLYYSRMSVSTEEHVRLEELTGLLLPNYLQNLTSEIQSAEFLTPNPLSDDFLPEGHPGPFVVFVRAGTRNDEFFSFRVFMMALKTYFWDTREIFRGIMRFRVKGRLLYVVGCPLSQEFCKYNPKGYMTLTPTKQLYKEIQEKQDKFEGSLMKSVSHRRAPAKNLTQVLELTNFV